MPARRASRSGGARPKGAAARSPAAPTVAAAARAARSGQAFLEDEPAQAAIEAAYPDGLSSAQLVELFTGAGVRLSEATFRKWVQLGLLPRSRRVGRKGKHQGSLGLYPPSTVRQIAAIRRLMDGGLTAADIARSRRLRDGVEALERALRDLLREFREQLSASPALPAGERAAAERQLEALDRQSSELFRRLSGVERRIVAPLEREARARAFGSGTSGGAGDLL